MIDKSLKIALMVLLFAGLTVGAQAQNKKKSASTKSTTMVKETKASKDTAGYAAAYRWADNKMKHMSIEDKVGQMMFVRVPQKMNKKQKREFEKNFRDFGVGGICFFKGSAANQIEQTKEYQKMSDIPLMVTIDAEWGLGMRLTDCYSFPRQMMMGALSRKNDTLIAQFGEEIGNQCRKMGINVNFAPVCDINNNPANPVIGCRSFGENKNRVATKSLMYARAMQRKGVIAVGKHFPGHGDTDVDSHLDLPVIKHSKDYIDSIDLFPFRHLVGGGIRGMMVAHLQVNALDNRKNMPSSLSERIVQPLLREQMEFDGLVFTDGIDMKAVAKHYKDGEGAIRAIKAGGDVILLPIDVEATIKAIVKEAKNNAAFAKMIDDRCRRILREKYLCGLHNMELEKLRVPTAMDNKHCQQLTKKIAQKAVTLIYDAGGVLPMGKELDVVEVSVGNCDNAITTLDSTLANRIQKAGNVIISVFGNVGAANNYGISDESMSVVRQICALHDTKSVVIVYGSPYIMEKFPKPAEKETSAPYPSAVVLAYQNIPEAIEAANGAVCGETEFEGVLPVSTGGYKEGTSLKPKPRPKPVDPYAELKNAGMKVECFKAIDSIAENGIKEHAYPGCQILVAKDGKVVYNRCYGRQTYSSQSAPMDTNTVYDLASLTKVTATNLAVMKLVDDGKIKLDDPLSRYLPYLKKSNKKKITIREALSHCAGLKAFDSYWKQSEESDDLYFGTTPPDGYTAIGDNTYISDKYRDKLLEQITDSKLNKDKKYVYSDLGFILLADLVEHVSGQRIDIFMRKHFYTPLGMANTTFQPIQNGIDIQRIAPTENEKVFRKQLLRGYVHDPNSAAMGGIAGHAGLFSTANDLFKIYQMMLDEGIYGGHRYIKAQTFKTFNKRHYADKGNRRALGFDKPLIKDKSNHVSPLASQSSFGHTGFTGIMVWVDPQYKLIYIFLSNRVHPSASPNKLSSMNIRTDIQTLIYNSIGVK